jgi:hypothetical protein
LWSIEVNIIVAEKLEFVYFAPNDLIPTSTLNEKRVAASPQWFSRLEQLKMSEMKDTRLIAITYPLSREVYYIRFLHWDISIDLSKLDNRVTDNTYTDDDFVDSLITTFGKTKCFNCQWEGFTLAFLYIDAYGALGLDFEVNKVRVRDQRDSFKNCPNCGQKFTQLVVKIFDASI